MKTKMTKLISLILIFALCLSLVAVSAEETEEAENTAADTQTVLASKYAEEIDVLSYLGIIDQNIDLVNAITRAEFTEMALALHNIPIGTYDYTKFYDINTGTKQCNVVMTAADAGIVKGGDGSMFSPDKNISYAEAATMIVRAIGSETMANLKFGGSSDSCLKFARYVGIAESGNAEAIKGVDAVKMLFKALESKYIDIVGATANGNAAYEAIDNTYLEEVFGLTRYTGIVTGTEYSKRIGGEGVYEDVIEIDGVNYVSEIISTYDAKDILGKNVYWYGKEDDGNIIAVIIGEREGRNTTVKVLPEDYISGSDSAVRYYNSNDKEVSVKLSSSAVIYYNDVRCLDITNSDFDISDGEIILLDNNNDKAYDYVFIREYKRYVVQDSSYGVITSYYDDWRVNTRGNNKWLIYHNGVEITSDHLGMWNEIKVMESKDGTFGIIEASKNTFEGEVTQIREKDKKTYVTVNNTYEGEREFELEKIYVDAYKAKRVGALEPVKGLSYAFVYNNEGRIYGATAAINQEYEYGFLIKAARGKGLDSTYQMKIFGTFGTMATYELSNNFKINGKRVEGDAIGAALAVNESAGGGQIIMYKKSDDGKLAEILTYTDASNGGTTHGYNLTAFSLDAQAEANKWSGTSYRLTVNGKTYSVPPYDEVPMFYIPADRSDDESYRYYSLQGAVDSATAYSKTAKIEVFDTVRYEEETDFSKLSAIAVYAAPESLSTVNPYTIKHITTSNNQQANYCVVKSVEEVVDSNGDVKLQLNYIPASGSKAYTDYFADKVYNVDTTGVYGFGNIEAADIPEGAIIRYNYANPYAKVLEIDKFYIVVGPGKYENLDYVKMDWATAYSSSETASRGYWAYGTVLYYDDYELILKTYDDYRNVPGKEKYISFVMNTNSVWQYNIKTGEISKTNMASIARGDRLVMRGSGLNDISDATEIVRIVEE